MKKLKPEERQGIPREAGEKARRSCARRCGNSTRSAATSSPRKGQAERQGKDGFDEQVLDMLRKQAKKFDVAYPTLLDCTGPPPLLDTRRGRHVRPLLRRPPRPLRRPAAHAPSTAATCPAGWLGGCCAPTRRSSRCAGRARPAWEPFLTHPAGFLVGIVAGAVIFVVGGIAVNWNGTLMTVPGGLAVVGVFGSLIVVAAMAGYFTRLVITNQRVMIVQGYEIRETWRLEDLPRSLVRISAATTAR